MKKICLVLALVLLSAAVGCSSDDGKVKVIDGPGKANSTMLIGFNELCGGTAEGFLGEGEKLLYSSRNGLQLTFNEIDTDSAVKQALCSTQAAEAASVVLAPDGTGFLYNNNWIDAVSGQMRPLSPVAPLREGSLIRSVISRVSSYSFYQKSEILLTDPQFYLGKYYATASAFGNTLQSSLSTVKFTLVRDTQTSPSRPSKEGSYESEILEKLEKLKTLTLPDVTSIKAACLVPERLKYIFTADTKNGGTPLYVLDLFEMKLTQVSSNAGGFTLSPGKSMAAYVEEGRYGDRDRLMTVDLGTGAKKELISLPQIQGVSWSSNGSWIAYFGGSSKIDVGIIKADGTAGEQLTNGMRPAGKPVWSGSGRKLAFTSYGEKGDTPKIYIITLNTHEDGWSEAPETDLNRQAAASRLVDFLRAETASFLKGQAVKIK